MKSKVFKILIYVLLDCVAVALGWVLGVALTGDKLTVITSHNVRWLFFGACVFALLINALFGLYNKMLKYFDFNDAGKVFLAGICEIVYFSIAAIVSENLNISWAVISSIVYFMVLMMGRFIYKIYAFLSGLIRLGHNKHSGVRVMIIGAGSAGSSIIHEMHTSNKSNYYPVCVLDDDNYKIGQSIGGVNIAGPIKDVEKYVEEYSVEEIVIAMPGAGKKVQSQVIKYCQNTGCKVKIIPGYYQILNGDVSVSDIKIVEISDILGREQVSVNLEEIMGYIKGKVVMVTGGGGSIGSELCRQIASHNPKTLIIVDIYENNAYDIQQELKRKYVDLDLQVLIASVRNAKRIDSIFEEFKPEIVFHAAAHKHVPLMEDSPNEAIKNNIGGTYNVADAAGRFGTKKFILISTDKAVNPTNVMGATKRVCEMIIQTMDKKYDTEYVAVRFGNVLGSNGSVVPLFKKQIASGGPITVTHKDIVRYFMTIPEAVSLVLQAGAYAKGGEIFVLDMGEPVRIYDMAINMIKLSGLTPYKDIDIVITGLRPGEKLYEERLMEEEGLTKTQNQLISIGKPLEFNKKDFFIKIEKLVNDAYEETKEMKKLLSKIVTTYKIDEGKNN